MTEFGEIVNNTTYIVETEPCFVCGESGQVEVPMKGFLMRQLGALIQEAYPDLDKALREQMMTGVHPECWKKTFGFEHGNSASAKAEKEKNETELGHA
jgi:hypothetical protein